MPEEKITSEEDNVPVIPKKHCGFGEILKNVRIEKLNMNQTQLAEKLRMNQTMLCRLEKGVAEPRYFTLLHIIESTTRDPRDFFPPFTLYRD